MNEAGRRRLDSWKEIADYIGRDVRTAIRWEAERGLPVHRVPGGKRGSVFTFTDEIDRWLLSVAVGGDHSGDSGALARPGLAPGADPQHPEPMARESVMRARWLVPVAAAVVLVTALGVLLRVYVSARRAIRVPVAAISLAGNELVTRERSGGALWRHDFGRAVRTLEDTHVAQPARLFSAADDLMGDERSGFLVSVPFVQAATPMSPDWSELFAFSGGKVLWSHRVRESLTFGAGTFGPPWHSLLGLQGETGAQVAVFEVDGKKRIAWAQSHHTWWPSVLTVLDAAGHRVSTWVHSGEIRTVVPATSPAGPRLLVGGISNSREEAFFAVLDARHAEGAGPEQAGSPFECRSCGPGRPLRYFVISPSEQMRASAPYNHVADVRPAEDGVEVRTLEGAPSSSSFCVQAVLGFSPDFTLEHAAWSSAWAAGHRELEKAGKLDHAVANCPERDRPPHVREWTPGRGWRDLTPPIPAVRPRVEAASLHARRM